MFGSHISASDIGHRSEQRTRFAEREREIAAFGQRPNQTERRTSLDAERTAVGEEHPEQIGADLSEEWLAILVRVAAELEYGAIDQDHIEPDHALEDWAVAT